MKNVHLVIGLGEVGTGVAEVLSCPGIDKDEKIPTAEVIHICFPYSNRFVQFARKYKIASGARLAIIHSTIPLGTTRKCGEDFVHSPIRGKHPYLAEGIRTFVKFFGGPRAREAASYFADIGVRVVTTTSPENTEAMKLWDTEIYREAILLNKRIHSYCKEHGLDFDIVYLQANVTYNDGYVKLGNPEYTKYVLQFMDGPIGGHCLEQNHSLLEREVEKDN